MISSGRNYYSRSSNVHNEPIIIKNKYTQTVQVQDNLLRVYYVLTAKATTVNTNATVPALAELTKLPSELMQQLEDESKPIINKLI